MALLRRTDGAGLAYVVLPHGNADGPPFIFLHGMGGTSDQPLSYLDGFDRLPVISMDARGHGESSDVIGPDGVSFEIMADDVVALLDELAVPRVVLGGISMGAAIAANFATRYPERVVGLVLCRPAWSTGPQDDLNQDAYQRIASLLEEFPAPAALGHLEHNPTFLSIAARSPAAGDSLRHQVARPRAAINSALLRTLPTNSPVAGLGAWSIVTAPTLVIAHRGDPLHPWDVAQDITRAIDSARLVEVPSKDVDPVAFTTEILSAITEFIDDLPGGGS